jgi:hypothetical protein
MADNEGKHRVQEQRKYHYGKPLPRHGSPRDRGSADAYYGRQPRPHYFVGKTRLSKEIHEDGMSDEEINEYYKGYNEEEDRKDWGEE